MSRNHKYHTKFPLVWVAILRHELYNEFPMTSLDQPDLMSYLPPVDDSSWVGRLAAKLPSKPQGITIGGVIYYTPHYPTTKKKFLDGLPGKYGEKSAQLYEFGMYAHEAYHAVEQEMIPNFKIAGIPILSGKTKWLMRYINNLIKMPNAYTHPAEVPAYDFQRKLKALAEQGDAP